MQVINREGDTYFRIKDDPYRVPRTATLTYAHV